MRWKVLLSLTAGVAVAIAAASSAEAAKKAAVQQSGVPGQRTVYTYTDENGRRHTKIIVQRRSFLDAGTTVTTGQRKYSDYVRPPYSSVFDVLGPGRGAYERNPLGPTWEFGGGGGYLPWSGSWPNW